MSYYIDMHGNTHYKPEHNGVFNTRFMLSLAKSFFATNETALYYQICFIRFTDDPYYYGSPMSVIFLYENGEDIESPTMF